jgi:ABC-type transporter Mla subunit MlaD
LNSGFDWSAFLDVAGGVAAFFAGLGILWVCLAASRTLKRLNRTLDAVDEQIAALGRPASEALAHVGGIADTADQTLARLSGVVASLEQIAGSAAQTAKLTQDAVSPAIVNLGSVLAGISAGLRRLFRGDRGGENA